MKLTLIGGMIVAAAVTLTMHSKTEVGPEAVSG